ncbi:MAG TPA: Dam family site-specific DNA-(adenine-N6)-methyltransferase [Solirubrobacteraceae bacterium]|jgi:DNA adenine methylase
MAPTPATLTVRPGRALIATVGGRTIDLGASTTSNDHARPFLKWTGGKQWLAAVASSVMPEDFVGRYIEPFLGGGSVFFAVGSRKATLGDMNAELIEAYQGVRDCPEKVIAALARYPHDREFFEAMRRARPRAIHTKAARLIYLNKTAFNGMYRVNLRGEFNVPFGRYVNPTICDPDRIRRASHALRGTTLRVGDFAATMKAAKPGDVVYLDPPYITGHRNNGFLKYNAPLFSWEDQQRLAALAIRLANRGVFVIVSNSDHGDVISLYKGFFRYGITRNSLIGGQGSHRGPIQEALLTSTPIHGVPTHRM